MNIRSIFAGIFVGVAGLSQAAVIHVPELTLFGAPYTRSEIYNSTIHNLNPDNPDDMLQLLAPAAESPEVQDSTAVEEIVTTPLPAYYFRPAVFSSFQFLDTMRVSKSAPLADSPLDPNTFGWLVTDLYHNDLIRHARQAVVVRTPYLVRYDEASLPEPPKKFEANVDPKTAKIVIAEIIPEKAPEQKLEAQFYKRHWLKTFNGSVQFSQAYVSPNWYQGGNKNLNMLVNLYYNVKLNPAFHKKFLFETTFQYKLGMNDAPNDSLRNYSVSEDLFQFNMLVGYKASKRWYYSTNVSFKTQFLKNYKPNTHELKGAFMSPGELNVGVGMTYNYANKKKTFTFDASISPLSYNLKTCFRKRLSVKGIEEGKTSVSEYGSSGEGKLQWQMCDNISLRSRLFVFSDYDYIQSDWENTLQFTINRFLSTQIYVHMRYDSSSPVIEDTDWHKLQLKEILSIGFTYKFGNS